MYKDFSKIVRIIKSCETYKHLITANKCITRFEINHTLKGYNSQINSTFLIELEDLYYKKQKEVRYENSHI